MKTFASFSLVLLLGAAAFGADAPVATVAPQEIPELLPKKTNQTTAVIKLHYVKPTLMVQWLDAKNHPETMMDCGGIRTTSGVFPKTQTIFDLPEGIDNLVAIEQQNSVLAHGTNEAVKQLKQLIALVDQPRKTVELEVALYTTDLETVKKLNSSVVPPASTDKTPLAVSDTAVGLIFLSKKNVFEEAVARGQAQLLKTEKLRALNNLAICSETKFPINDALQLSTFQIKLVLTINGDGTITVLAQPSIQQTKTIENQEAPAYSNSMVNTVFIARDGDTVGLSLGTGQDKTQMWLCLITPRLVKENAVSPQK